MKIRVIGIDLAKSVFQVCVQMEDGSISWNRKVKRNRLLDSVRQFPEGCLIAMEACATAHYWGRTIEGMGYQVMLIPAQHVKPLARRQKNDANDAVAICEAAFRPGVHPVAVKTVEQQDIKALRCVRRRMVEERTALANQIRSLAAEYGVVFRVGMAALRSQVPDAIEDPDNQFSHVLRGLLQGLLDDLKFLDRDIADVELQLKELCQQNESYLRLMAIPGYGPVLTAAFISEIGDGAQFTNGRQLSAWCGLIPRQHSSGGRSTLGAITKQGNREIRTLLIHGARAVVRVVDKRDDAMSRWLKALIARRGKAKAAVALANKLGRIGWRVVNGHANFNLALAFKPLTA